MTTSELRADVHSIEPIPEADRDSTGPQQMWIWAGANIAPINWALGALGIILKLGLWETVAVIVLGNIIGCAIFAAFTVMGHKTAVNQMVLSRSAFGRRGVPAKRADVPHDARLDRREHLLPGQDRGRNSRPVRDS